MFNADAFPQYEPPYESPIEEAFAWDLSKRLAAAATLQKQVLLPTQLGMFRCDFLLTTPTGVQVAIECDGRAFHRPNRDRFRDAAILADTEVQAVLRFSGRDIYQHSPDVVFIVGRLIPGIFSERGQSIVNKLCSPEAALQYETLDRGLMVEYVSEEDDTAYTYLLPTFRGSLPGASRDWRDDVVTIRAERGTSADELAAKYPSAFG